MESTLQFYIPEKQEKTAVLVIPKASRVGMASVNNIVYNNDVYEAAIIKLMAKANIPIVYQESVQVNCPDAEKIISKYTDIIGVIREFSDHYVVAEFPEENLDYVIDALSNGALMGMNYIANYSVDISSVVTYMDIFSCSLIKLPETYARKCLKDLRGISINEYTAKFYGLAHK